MKRKRETDFASISRFSFHITAEMQMTVANGCGEVRHSHATATLREY
jgi:hypothetical protein